MTKVAKYGLSAGVGLAALILWALSGGTGTSVETAAVESPGEVKQQGGVEEAQEMAALELRKQLPMQIDETTTLQSALGVGKTLIYYYRISQLKSDIDNDSFIVEARETLRQDVCQKKQMRSTLNIGGMYNYVYLSLDGIVNR